MFIKEIFGLKRNLIKMNFFSNRDQLPRLTEKGFQVVKVPDKAWKIICETYNLLKIKNPIKEPRLKTSSIIEIKNNKNKIGAEFLDLCSYPTIRSIIEEELKDTHEKWVNKKLKCYGSYGIRSYLNQSILNKHFDHLRTHHVSSIIIVDKDGEDWPLDIKAHDGTWHKVYCQPGEMILYESAICEHARLTPFKGNFFRNFFIHFTLEDYTYKDPQKDVFNESSINMLNILEKDFERVDKKYKIWTKDNFLDKKICEKIIKYIRKGSSEGANHLYRLVDGKYVSGFTQKRHRSCKIRFFDKKNDPKYIKEIDLKLLKTFNYNKDYGETINGIFYEKGAYFKDHWDGNGDGKNGDRVFTCLIYLNEVKKGGGTLFSKINLNIEPKIGKIIVWQNIERYGGETITESYHTGQEILEGEKFVINKFFKN